MKDLYYVILISFILLSLLIISCIPPPPKVSDPSTNAKVAGKAGAYLYGCPDYYYPPVFNNTGTTKSLHGAVSWNVSIYVGDPQFIDTKGTFINRLNKATDKEKTNSYNTYVKADGAGFPGYLDGTSQGFPERKYQTGFVCYALLYRAITDAGFSMNVPLSVTDVLNGRAELGPEETAYPGDIVAYDFDNDNVYDHVGILTEVKGVNKKDWKAISSIGIVEIFQYGAAETRVGVFGDSSVGGEFNVWNPSWNNYTIKIFRLN
ncbi:MAG: hypothetical protein ACM3O3_06925 [Syntrophothermus sp.]